MKIHIRPTKTGGQFYFTVNARNGQVMLTSENYLSQKNVEKAVRTFRAKVAELDVIRHDTFK